MTGPDNMDGKERLAALLDAYGADVRRWPEEERAGHALALAETELEEHVRDARVLDRLLAAASRPVAPQGAVARLIALATPDARAGNVTDLAGRARRRGVSGPPAFSLPAVSALAASLLLGLYLGASGMTERLLPEQSAGNTEVAQIYELDVLDGTVGFLAEQGDT
ncbi:MAG: hypothetical protein AB7S41_06960 [Parvibaculaceae bacterium]